MAWGFWKKIKNAFSKAGKWVKDKIINPVINVGKKVGKPVLNTAVKLAPVIGTAVGAKFGQPAMGAQIGSTVQTLGNSLGLGK